MRLLQLLLIIILAGTLHVTAQEFKLGKVSVEELQEKVHPADTSAPAAYLYKRGKTFFELNDGYFNMVTEVECRIKIYKKEGYSYASEEIACYTGGKTIKMYFTDAYTYNLEGGKIEKTKLKADGEFQEQVNENVRVKKITMPNVKEGSVIEFKYVIITPYFTAFEDWYFQYPIPANYVTYEVALPNYFTYNRFMTGYTPIEQTAPKARLGSRGIFQETAVTFTAKNVKALADESFVHNIDNYISILKHELASVQLPNSTPEKYSTDWPSVAKAIYEDNDFGRELGLTNYFKEDLQALVPSGTPPAQKLEIIFGYVKNRMNWNDKNGYYCIDGVKKAYENKVGNVGEINLMLPAMLRHAGLDANPVLVSTRDNGVAIYPARTAYNYVIAGVKLDNNIILLDATSKYTLPNILPLRALNWVGRMIKSNGATEEIDLMPKKNSREMITVSAEVAADGKVTGKTRDQYFDHYGYVFRETYGTLAVDSYLEKLEEYYGGVLVSDYSITNERDLTKPVMEEYNFSHDNVSEVIGNKIYLNPMLFFSMDENPFKQEKREYPIEFDFPHQDKYLLNITIPQGYEIESMPKSVSMAMEENIGTFRYNIGSKDRVVQVSVAFDINYANISQDYYHTIKDFFQKMIEKQNEKIVLKKSI